MPDKKMKPIKSDKKKEKKDDDKKNNLELFSNPDNFSDYKRSINYSNFDDLPNL